MQKTIEYGTVFAVGAIGYGVIELLWRGFTHWTMILTGGICLLCIYLNEVYHRSAPMWKRCLVGSLVISFSEITVGFVVNILLHWAVWDYSTLPMNLFGQVCVTYSLLWFLLCIPVTYLCTWLRSALRAENENI
ncbi:MAG: hypothetical protein IJY93_06350 [Clostridia bacterium]|nr:hypothetical protein [Clostridia bacterium]